MPRMEVCSADTYCPDPLDQAYEAAGQGSDTFDLCNDCAGEIEGLALAKSEDDPGYEGADEAAPAWLKLSVEWPEGHLIELAEGADHPPYGDAAHIIGEQTYGCVACGEPLTSYDD